MHYTYTLLPLTAALAATVSGSTTPESDTWYFGDTFFYLGPPTNANIIKATYTITPPSVPTGYYVDNADDEVWVSVWVGASSSDGSLSADLYQPLFNWSPNQESQGCSASADEWCVAASTYTPSGQTGLNYVIVPKGSSVDFEMVVEDKKVIQKVLIGGEVVSQESDDLDSGLQYLYSSNECYTGSGSCGTVNGYTISNITVTLDKADKNFGESMWLYEVEGSEFASSDDGITWHMEYVKTESTVFADMTPSY
ncbi:hypothetical protein P175DRAFT_0483070 [Aspergillus ochraceoroseus IBT 24754]|uniref:Concanavalin A-like lectin/glucanase n=3 Tax=Aspergillus subgen. Nidulantes TaxID=2720870 RepID=A0A0F8UX54_9EURO|nr:uncharacterized protein P175DRAFT_0483070 [Aspergillus ochraceoroseus IBT 24754]KKK15376.1 hypothetical protein ARAM_006700 [Aspergillus rambellii]KKK15582.1 hypothetical protein AOCH_005477 [Aspergillus ochraceoroseus]PTU19550.1 hypothetical protein P175DRAFT_0483070 [Aspergillus ochraceoroseus IBT 24754]